MGNGWEARSIVNRTDDRTAQSLVIRFSYCSLSSRGAPRVRGWSPYCKDLHGRNQTLPGEITCYRFYCPVRGQIWLETSAPVSGSWRIWSASSTDRTIRSRADYSLVSSWWQLGSALLFVAANLEAVSHPLSRQRWEVKGFRGLVQSREEDQKSFAVSGREGWSEGRS